MYFFYIYVYYIISLDLNIGNDDACAVIDSLSVCVLVWNSRSSVVVKLLVRDVCVCVFLNSMCQFRRQQKITTTPAIHAAPRWWIVNSIFAMSQDEILLSHANTNTLNTHTFVIIGMPFVSHHSHIVWRSVVFTFSRNVCIHHVRAGMDCVCLC